MKRMVFGKERKNIYEHREKIDDMIGISVYDPPVSVYFKKIKRMKDDNYERCSICNGSGYRTVIVFGNPGTIKEPCRHCGGTGYQKKIKIKLFEDMKKESKARKEKANEKRAKLRINKFKKPEKPSKPE